MNTKVCSKCGEEKLLSMFYARNDQPYTKTQSRCKKCTIEDNVDRRKTHPEKYRNYYTSEKGQDSRKKTISQRYGLSLKEYKDMFIKRSNKCDICHKTSKTTLHVDHSHKTGEIRGLLCSKCNHAIGLLDVDNGISNLENAIQYIKGEVSYVETK